MEDKKPTPEKVVVDLDDAIDRAIEKRIRINRVVVLSSEPHRVELQSNDEEIKSLLKRAEESLGRLKGSPSSRKPQGYMG